MTRVTWSDIKFINQNPLPLTNTISRQELTHWSNEKTLLHAKSRQEFNTVKEYIELRSYGNPIHSQRDIREILSHHIYSNDVKAIHYNRNKRLGINNFKLFIREILAKPLITYLRTTLTNYDINYISPYYPRIYKLQNNHFKHYKPKKRILKIASWNVRGMVGHEYEIKNYIQNEKLDMIAIQEPKSGKYIPRHKRIGANKSKAVWFINPAFHPIILKKSKYMTIISIKQKYTFITLISIYIPCKGNKKSKEERKTAVKELKDFLDDHDDNIPTYICGDFNSHLLPDKTIQENDTKPLWLKYEFSPLRRDVFIKHTWENSLHKTTIDFFLGNAAARRSLNSAWRTNKKEWSDHFCLRMNIHHDTKQRTIHKEQINNQKLKKEFDFILLQERANKKLKNALENSQHTNPIPVFKEQCTRIIKQHKIQAKNNLRPKRRNPIMHHNKALKKATIQLRKLRRSLSNSNST